MTYHIQSSIKKWGDSLGLRITGAVKDIPQFKKGMLVDIEVFEDGFTVKKSKAKLNEQAFVFPLKEKDLLNGLNANTAHADEIAVISNWDDWFDEGTASQSFMVKRDQPLVQVRESFDD